MIFKTLPRASVLLVLLFIGFSSFAQNASPEVQRVLIPKNPGTAFVYSAILPGSGQMYNDQVALGLIVLGSEAGLVTLGSYLTSLRYATFENQMGNVMFGTAALAYLAQLIYAPIQSSRINKRNNLNYSSRFKLGSNSRGEFGLSFNF